MSLEFSRIWYYEQLTEDEDTGRGEKDITTNYSTWVEAYFEPWSKHNFRYLRTPFRVLTGKLCGNVVVGRPIRGKKILTAMSGFWVL